MYPLQPILQGLTWYKYPLSAFVIHYQLLPALHWWLTPVCCLQAYFAVSRLWKIPVCLGKKTTSQEKSHLYLARASPSCSPQMWHFIRTSRWLHLLATPWKGGCQWDEDVQEKHRSRIWNHCAAQLRQPQNLPRSTHCSSRWGVCGEQQGTSLNV